MSELGWVGKKVAHRDGRTGKITREFIGFGFVALTIRSTDGREAYLQLNTDGTSGGERGWQWWCENFSSGARWLPLADEDDPIQENEIAPPGML